MPVTSSSRQSTNSLRDGVNQTPWCCCCSAQRTIAFTSGITFLLSFVVLIVGVFVNEKVQGWGLSSIGILGNICIALGCMLSLVSLLGLCASRGSANSRTVWLGDRSSTLPLSLYFMLNLMMASFLLLAGLYAWFEGNKIRSYVAAHWSTVRTHVVGSADEGPSYEEAVEALRNYMAIVAGVAPCARMASSTFLAVSRF